MTIEDESYKIGNQNGVKREQFVSPNMCDTIYGWIPLQNNKNKTDK